MSYTASQIGYGVSFSHSTTLGGTYTPFAELLSISPGKISVEEVKVMRSDNATATVEKIHGWKEVDDCEIELSYLAGGGAAVSALIGVPLFFKATYPLIGTQTVGDTETFFGFMRELDREIPLKDSMKIKAKFCINGDITFTAGS